MLAGKSIAADADHPGGRRIERQQSGLRIDTCRKQRVDNIAAAVSRRNGHRALEPERAVRGHGSIAHRCAIRIVAWRSERAAADHRRQAGLAAPRREQSGFAKHIKVADGDLLYGPGWRPGDLMRRAPQAHDMTQRRGALIELCFGKARQTASPAQSAPPLYPYRSGEAARWRRKADAAPASRRSEARVRGSR